MTLELSETSDETYDDEWAERSRFWLAEYESGLSKRKRRDRNQDPLILVGNGLSIRVSKGRLLIRDGTTHYPSAYREVAYFKGSLELPLRIVVVDGSGSITLDAIDWLNDQDIPLIRIRFDGRAVTVMGSNGYAADPAKVAWQLKTRDDPKRKLEFAIRITREKLIASLETLENYVPSSNLRDGAATATRACLEFIKRGDADTPSKLLGQEGKAAAAYWRAWQGIDIKWRATTRYPVPDDWQVYLSRSSLSNERKIRNFGASHPVNAMLNYAYAVLLTKMKIQAIADGYDPMIGILHDQRHKEKDLTPSFALDLMEPHRPVVDRVVLKLIADETFSGADFDIQSNGVCRVNPELVRYLTEMKSS